MPAAPDIRTGTDTDLDDASDIEHAIEALLDDRLPADWNDPAVIERRRGRLRTAASRCAEATLEMLVHNQLARARCMPLASDDPTVDAFAAALTTLHQAIRHYRRDTRLRDALEVARQAMAVEKQAPALPSWW